MCDASAHAFPKRKSQFSKCEKQHFSFSRNAQLFFRHSKNQSSKSKTKFFFTLTARAIWKSSLHPPASLGWGVRVAVLGMLESQIVVAVMAMGARSLITRITSWVAPGVARKFTRRQYNIEGRNIASWDWKLNIEKWRLDIGHWVCKAEHPKLEHPKFQIRIRIIYI